ncbi:hypothetical protein [Delftia acidovorans]|uniref:Uncharacterized protein n=1 Tax=Delftia acidovorans TaxID=80866 RepID=A0AAJ2R8D8_DELAC|nr:hypothetical protein [Delftia acidovorans]MDX4957883.1 hypothetical protein [Delftia acidovorans]
MKKTVSFVILATFAFFAQAQWVYEKQEDKMTSKTASFARVKSVGSLNLEFPYRGTNHGWIEVRQHPTYGLDVIFSIEKGQILCSTYQGCPVHVRFDDGAVMKFEGVGAADHDSKIVFLNNPKRFIAAAAKAKKILLQANIYKAGAPVVEFKTESPLVWSTKK